MEFEDFSECVAPQKVLQGYEHVDVCMDTGMCACGDVKSILRDIDIPGD